MNLLLPRPPVEFNLEIGAGRKVSSHYPPKTDTSKGRHCITVLAVRTLTKRRMKSKPSKKKVGALEGSQRDLHCCTGTKASWLKSDELHISISSKPCSVSRALTRNKLQDY